MAIVLFGLACLILLFAAGRLYLRERRARKWPTITARIVETPPQSMFESTGRMSVFNHDSDHLLEWIVNGQPYRTRIEDDANFSVSGFKIWRRPPSGASRVLHFNPASPSKHMLVEEFGAWRFVLGLAVAAGIGVAVLSVF